VVQIALDWRSALGSHRPLLLNEVVDHHTATTTTTTTTAATEDWAAAELNDRQNGRTGAKITRPPSHLR
jgi:hypothetical protein